VEEQRKVEQQQEENCGPENGTKTASAYAKVSDRTELKNSTSQVVAND
jgi:hypothetical protein